jgi:hypothetical protein
MGLTADLGGVVKIGTEDAWVSQLTWFGLQRRKQERHASDSRPECCCKERNRRWLGPRAGLSSIPKREILILDRNRSPLVYMTAAISSLQTC